MIFIEGGNLAQSMLCNGTPPVGLLFLAGKSTESSILLGDFSAHIGADSET